MTYNLFLDDERMPSDCIWADWIGTIPNADWVIVRNGMEFFAALDAYGAPDYVSFDHDLGRGSVTGYVLARALVMYDMDGWNVAWNGKFYVHSKNPVGAENIAKYLKNYLAQR